MNHHPYFLNLVRKTLPFRRVFKALVNSQCFSLCALDIHAILEKNKQINKWKNPKKTPHTPDLSKNDIKWIYFKYYSSPNANNLLPQALICLTSFSTLELLSLLLWRKKFILSSSSSLASPCSSYPHYHSPPLRFLHILSP